MPKRQPRRTEPVAAAPIPRVVAPTGSVRLKLMVRALRPHQWSKNTLLFVPQLLAHQVFAWDKWLASGTAFLCFCLGASSVYLINDVIDLEADRAHPQKRNRPFASGQLSPSLAYR